VIFLRVIQRHRRLLLPAAACLCVALSAPARSQTPTESGAPDSASAFADTSHVPADTAAATLEYPDSVTATPPPVVTPVFRHTVFDSTLHSEYLFRHSYSLDNYLEFEPGFFLGRFGPIGKSTIQSRYAFGRGRASVYLNHTLINDPQNDIAPLPHFPVSGLGVLLESAGADGMLLAEDGLEGRIRVAEVAPDPEQPTTFLELSRSTQSNLRQRRVWFASMLGRIGLDFGYDEILNDGYLFDARPPDSPDFIESSDYGKSHSRYITINLRGEMPNRDRYTFSLRRFLADSQGSLQSSLAQQGLGGYLASIKSTMGRLRFNIYSRGYDANYDPGPGQPPDSNTVNLATAAFADLRVLGSVRRNVSIGGGFENINWVQNVGGASDDGELRKSTARVSAVADIGGGFTTRAQLSGVSYTGMTTGWGGRFAAERNFGRHGVQLYIRRGYRMPNLGELFLPVHTDPGAPGVPLSGNRYLESEYGWEAGGRATVRSGPITNELRALALRVHRPIAFTSTDVDGSRWLVAQNGQAETAGVIEDRIRLDGRLGAFEALLTGAASATVGDRVSYFATAPRWNAHASFRFGRSFFESTSALYVGLDYTYRSERGTLHGGVLPSYQVLNVKLDGRLLGADMYLMLMNVLDTQYQTIEGYLMTPRTFVYGISWKIFD